MQFSAARINRARKSSSAIEPAAKSNSVGACARGCFSIFQDSIDRCACDPKAESIRKTSESTRACPNRLLMRKISSALMCCSCFCQIASATETIKVRPSRRNGIACGRKPDPAARDHANFTANSTFPPFARRSFGNSLLRSIMSGLTRACAQKNSHSELSC
jgi:hypothetical protein